MVKSIKITSQLIFSLVLILRRILFNAFLPLTLGALITTFDTPGVAPFDSST